MYDDLRVRNSSRPTPVPYKHRAFIFRYNTLGSPVYKVILAPTLLIANQRIKDFTSENDLDFFWEFVTEDDFEVVYPFNVVPK